MLGRNHTTHISAIEHDKIKDTIATKTTGNKKAAATSVAFVSKKCKAKKSLSQPSSSTRVATDIGDTTHTKRFKREPVPDPARRQIHAGRNNSLCPRLGSMPSCGPSRSTIAVL